MFRKYIESFLFFRENMSFKYNDDVFKFKFMPTSDKDISTFICKKDKYKIIAINNRRCNVITYKIGFSDFFAPFYINNYVFKSRVSSKVFKNILAKEISNFKDYISLKPEILRVLSTLINNNLQNFSNNTYSFPSCYYYQLCESEYRLICQDKILKEHAFVITNEGNARISIKERSIKITSGVPHLFFEYVDSDIINKEVNINISEYGFLFSGNNKNIDFEGSLVSKSSYDKDSGYAESYLKFKTEFQDVSICIGEQEREITILLIDGEEKIILKGGFDKYEELKSQVNDFFTQMTIKYFLTGKFKESYGITHSQPLSSDEIETIKMMFY